MTKIRIYLKSGSIIDAAGEWADITIKRNAFGDMTSLGWEKITVGESPVYIRIEEVEAITVVMEDSDGVA